MPSFSAAAPLGQWQGMLNTPTKPRGKRRLCILTNGKNPSRPGISFLRKRTLGRRGGWLTQKELGELIGLSEQTVARIERGRRRPSFDALFLMAAALGQPPHVLYPELWQKAREVVEQRRHDTRAK